MLKRQLKSAFFLQEAFLDKSPSGLPLHVGYLSTWATSPHGLPLHMGYLSSWPSSVPPVQSMPLAVDLIRRSQHEEGLDAWGVVKRCEVCPE